VTHEKVVLPVAAGHRNRGRYRNRYRLFHTGKTDDDCDCDCDRDPDSDPDVFGFLLLFSEQRLDLGPHLLKRMADRRFPVSPLPPASLGEFRIRSIPTHAILTRAARGR
jgi:hypothetical protein